MSSPDMIIRHKGWCSLASSSGEAALFCLECSQHFIHRWPQELQDSIVEIIAFVGVAEGT